MLHVIGDPSRRVSGSDQPRGGDGGGSEGGEERRVGRDEETVGDRGNGGRIKDSRGREGLWDEMSVGKVSKKEQGYKKQQEY